MVCYDDLFIATKSVKVRRRRLHAALNRFVSANEHSYCYRSMTTVCRCVPEGGRIGLSSYLFVVLDSSISILPETATHMWLPGRVVDSPLYSSALATVLSRLPFDHCRRRSNKMAVTVASLFASSLNVCARLGPLALGHLLPQGWNGLIWIG